MRYIIFFVVTFLTSSPLLNAQDHEFGLIGGLTGYVGDLARPGTLFNIGAKANDKLVGLDNGGINGFYIYHFDKNDPSFFIKNAGIRANLLFAKLSGGAVSPDERYGDPRGLHFFTNIFELSAVYELDFLRFNIGKKHTLTLYAYAGAGLVNYNPKGYSYNSSPGSDPLPLKDYQTEGVDRKNTWSYTIPLGGGIKWKPWGERSPWTFGAEAAGRVTTDNLDDIKGVFPEAVPGDATTNFLSNPTGQGLPGRRRGNTYGFDIYKLLGLRVSYTLFDCDCPSW